MAKQIENLPIPNLDDKTFEELVAEAIARIPQYAHEWTDHNLSDPGITFIELFAWLAEMQIYRLNQLPERNYLKFLKLLNEKPAPAKPATVDVTFTRKDRAHQLPKRTQLVAQSPSTGEPVVFETDADLLVLPIQLAEIGSFADLTYRIHTEANNSLGSFYHPFGQKAEQNSVLYLAFDKVCPGKEMTLTFYLHGKKSAHGGERPAITPSAALRWEYRRENRWLPLNLEKDRTLTLSHSGQISFIMPDIQPWKLPTSEKGERFWIRCKVVEAGYEMPPIIDIIKLNTVAATQGETIERERLNRKDPPSETIVIDESISSGLPYQVFVSRQDVASTNQSILEEIDVLTLEVHEPDGTLSRWERQDDLDASGSEDNHYLLQPSEGEIIFGDGVNGRIPPKDSQIRLTYRFGGGEIGNLPANTTWKVRTPNRMLLRIEGNNADAASGGSEPESLEAAQSRVRKQLKETYRAVTTKDYETIAKATPGLRVARAKAVPDPDNNRVTVIVVPESPSDQPKPSPGFLQTVRRHLNTHRLLTTQLCVDEPDYVQVSVEASVRIKPQHNPAIMAQKIDKALATFLHPLKGGQDEKGWPFGRNVYKSEIYAVTEKVDGVDSVTHVTLQTDRYTVYQNGNLKISPLQLVYPGTHRIEILNPDPSTKNHVTQARVQ